MAVYRLRKVWPDYAGRVRLKFCSLAIELKNRRPTPKDIVDIEIPLMKEQQPDLPIGPWQAPEWRYVPTLLPAFEALKAAEEQGDEAAWEFSWLIRHAFFAQSRTICMRHELEAIAGEAGLEVDRFLRTWDGGVLRHVVETESHHGWEELKVPGSPTFVLPGGEQIANPGAIHMELGEHHEILKKEPANCPDGDCLRPFRAMLEKVIAG
jgi:hypothetical protein